MSLETKKLKQPFENFSNAYFNLPQPELSINHNSNHNNFKSDITASSPDLDNINEPKSYIQEQSTSQQNKGISTYMSSQEMGIICNGLIQADLVAQRVSKGDKIKNYRTAKYRSSAPNDNHDNSDKSKHELAEQAKENTRILINSLGSAGGILSDIKQYIQDVEDSLNTDDPNMTFPKMRSMWSASEDRLLTLGVKIYGANTESWPKIAVLVPGRTNKACRKRWFHSLDPTLHKGSWSTDEDDLLRYWVEKLPGQWSKIAKKIQGRTDDQCAKRWRESLDPNISRTKWSPEEDNLLLSKYNEYGAQWQKIATFFDGRPGLHCRNRWRKIQRRTQQESEKITGKRNIDSQQHEQHKRSKNINNPTNNLQKKIKKNFGNDISSKVTQAHKDAAYYNDISSSYNITETSFLRNSEITSNNSGMYSSLASLNDFSFQNLNSEVEQIKKGKTNSLSTKDENTSIINDSQTNPNTNFSLSTNIIKQNAPNALSLSFEYQNSNKQFSSVTENITSKNTDNTNLNFKPETILSNQISSGNMSDLHKANISSLLNKSNFNEENYFDSNLDQGYNFLPDLEINQLLSLRFANENQTVSNFEMSMKDSEMNEFVNNSDIDKGYMSETKNFAKYQKDISGTKKQKPTGKRTKNSGVLPTKEQKESLLKSGIRYYGCAALPGICDSLFCDSHSLQHHLKNVHNYDSSAERSDSEDCDRNEGWSHVYRCGMPGCSSLYKNLKSLEYHIFYSRKSLHHVNNSQKTRVTEGSHKCKKSLKNKKANSLNQTHFLKKEETKNTFLSGRKLKHSLKAGSPVVDKPSLKSKENENSEEVSKFIDGKDLGMFSNLYNDIFGFDAFCSVFNDDKYNFPFKKANSNFEKHNFTNEPFLRGYMDKLNHQELPGNSILESITKGDASKNSGDLANFNNIDSMEFSSNDFDSVFPVSDEVVDKRNNSVHNHQSSAESKVDYDMKGLELSMMGVEDNASTLAKHSNMSNSISQSISSYFGITSLNNSNFSPENFSNLLPTICAFGGSRASSWNKNSEISITDSNKRKSEDSSDNHTFKKANTLNTQFNDMFSGLSNHQTFTLCKNISAIKTSPEPKSGTEIDKFSIFEKQNMTNSNKTTDYTDENFGGNHLEQNKEDNHVQPDSNNVEN
ncbi:hypothetical protein BB559_005033 [Furculomyces boomerangus]|uniref:Uncharacterized protein n=1 Tax=Furculomyces boomerangus TaxID=61424 RepID=A0A2T9YB60_9FUNG|nr:hypothetical protein BB559_005033 [Furculomyces boomerangus]